METTRIDPSRVAASRHARYVAPSGGGTHVEASRVFDRVPRMVLEQLAPKTRSHEPLALGAGSLVEPDAGVVHR